MTVEARGDWENSIRSGDSQVRITKVVRDMNDYQTFDKLGENRLPESGTKIRQLKQ